MSEKFLPVKWGAVVGWALLLAATADSLGQQPAHSTSSSGQFIVYGGDVRLRGAMCDLAERTKASATRRLGASDDWKTPLLVSLKMPEANLPEQPPTHFEVSQIGTGLKMQLDLLVGGNFNGREAQREFLRAILVEMIYRSRPNVAAGTPYATPPDWLVDGLLQLGGDRNSTEATEILQTVVDSNRLLVLDEVVRQKRAQLDHASLKIHEAYAMALVQLLTETPERRTQLRKYLADLPDAPNEPMADLQVHFPTTLARAPSKWWTLGVARLSAANRYQIFSAAETSKHLDQLLRKDLSGLGEKSPNENLENYRNLLTARISRADLHRMSEQLLALATRAHPAYRKIVEEYYHLAALLSRGETSELSRRFTRVVSDRAYVDQQCRAMRDYMNWFEATQLKTISGTFSDVLESVQQANEPPPRHDAISVYLDSVEAQAE